MTSILPLPVRERKLSGESLRSLIRRTATAMGYENVGRILSLLKDMERVPAQVELLMPGPVWERVGRLLRRSTADLKMTTMHQFAPSLMLVAVDKQSAEWCDSKTALRFFSLTRAPVCPLCLADDAQPYERLIWSFRPVPVCPKHACRLVCECPKCKRILRPRRLHVCKCTCGLDIRFATPTSVPEATAKTVETVLWWLEGQHLPVTSLKACATFWWLERLASAEKKTRAWSSRDDESSSDDPWIAATGILTSWPERLYEFLDEFTRVTKHRTTATGVTRSFGLLLREAKYLEELGFCEPADALRQYLTEHYTHGQLTSKICLFNESRHQVLLSSRPWMTLTEADEKLHFRKGGSAALVERGILDGKIRSAQSGHRTVGLVARDSVELLIEDLKTAHSVSEASEQLSIGRRGVLQLIKADELPRSVWTSGGWRIPRSSVELLVQMINQCAIIKLPSSRWITVKEATRRFGPTGLNLTRLVQLVKSHRVNARRIASHHAFQGLMVSSSDLFSASDEIRSAQDDERGYPLNRLAKTLFPDRPMKETVLKKWIAMGLIHAERYGRALVVAPNEVDRFRSDYCLFRDAAKILEIHKTTLQRWVANGELTPVYGPRVTSGAGFNLFFRKDVEQLREFVQRHHRKWRASQPSA